MHVRLVLVSCIILHWDVVSLLFMHVDTSMSEIMMLVKLNSDAVGNVHEFSVIPTDCATVEVRNFV